eukprot:6176988-Pleurochrysis_carterae.AAC.8
MGYDPVGVRNVNAFRHVLRFDMHASFVLVLCASSCSVMFCAHTNMFSRNEKANLRRRPGPKTLVVFAFCAMLEIVRGQARSLASSRGTEHARTTTQRGRQHRAASERP